MRAPPSSDVGSESGDVRLVNETGNGELILVCEHATNFVPVEYAGLGLEDLARNSHIAWDPGAWQVAEMLSAEFDAPLIAPGVSRLVYDCNRPTQAESAVPQISETYTIPGNIGLSDAMRRARAAQFYLPYRNTLISVIEAALAEGRRPAIVTVHSFTPVYKEERRTLDLGVLHDDDDRLANALLDAMSKKDDLTVRRNEPYGPEHGVTYTLAEHALPRRLLNVMIEIRNDLIAEPGDQQAMAQRLADHLRAAMVNASVDHNCEVSS